MEQTFLDGVRHHFPDLDILYVALKGSRLFGIDEPDSDVDLRIVFKAPTVDFLGLDDPELQFQRMVVWNGYELDLVAWELKHFMRQLLKHNGNAVEALLVPKDKYWSDDRGEILRSIAPRYLTKQLYHFYRGYSMNQLKRASSQVRTAKGLLYTYREIYAGIWLLRHGEIIFDWKELKTNTEALLDWRSQVLDICTNTREELPDDIVERAQKEYVFLNGILDFLYKNSESIPDGYNGYDKLSNLLLRWRSRGWS